MRLPQGFLSSGVTAGFKPSGRPDLALIASRLPAAWAFVGTRNMAAAACVIRARALYASGAPLSAIIVNSGNANAVTGDSGREADQAMAERAAETLGLEPGTVLTASTGVIGRLLPVDRLVVAVPLARMSLGDEVEPALAAIQTTDTREKKAERVLSNGARIVGFAKGSGMIHPDMATMLGFILTDARVDETTLRETFQGLVDRTFNAVTVDGDTSTNDMCVCLANGAAGPVAFQEFRNELYEVMRDLARAVARDGEGADKLITVRVSGAPDDAAARRAARLVAGSNLLKAAVHGNDPNWGRALAALGRSGLTFRPRDVSLNIQGVCVFDGAPQTFDSAQVSAAMGAEEVVFEIGIRGSARGTGEAWGCDLTAEYVSINSDYTT